MHEVSNILVVYKDKWITDEVTGEKKKVSLPKRVKAWYYEIDKQWYFEVRYGRARSRFVGKKMAQESTWKASFFILSQRPALNQGDHVSLLHALR